MHEFTISSGATEDVSAITRLYREVAAEEGGLARVSAEVTGEYVDAFVRKSIANGVILVARDVEGDVIGEIHCYGSGLRVFAHVLGELTIVVHPKAQGGGAGRALFTQLLQHVREDRPDILRVELIARESNAKAIAFYERLGFRREGRFEARVASVGGGFEADIPMAWLRE